MTASQPQHSPTRGRTTKQTCTPFQEQERARAAEVDIEKFRAYGQNMFHGPDQESVTWGPLHTVPRRHPPIRRPRRRVWVPEGPANSWFRNGVGHLFLSRPRKDREPPPPYWDVDPEHGQIYSPNDLEPRRRHLRDVVGSGLKKAVSTLLPIGEALLGKEIALVKEFRQWRQERHQSQRAQQEFTPVPSEAPGKAPKPDAEPYTVVIGFEDSRSERPNWRGKLTIEVADPTRETSWLGPLDQDCPRWIWESYRLPDEWFEGWETPSMKYRQGQEKAFLMDVSEPLW